METKSCLSCFDAEFCPLWLDEYPYVGLCQQGVESDSAAAVDSEGQEKS